MTNNPPRHPICRHCSSPNVVFKAILEYDLESQSMRTIFQSEGGQCRNCGELSAQFDWVDARVFEVLASDNKTNFLVLCDSHTDFIRALGDAPFSRTREFEDPTIDVKTEINFYLPSDDIDLQTALRNAYGNLQNHNPKS